MAIRRPLKWIVVTLLIGVVAVDLADRYGFIHLHGTASYQSSAQILFSPVRITVDGPALMSGFSEYVTDQCLIIRSPRELQLALQQKAWAETGKGDSPQIAADFASRFTVAPMGNSVTVTFIHEDPKIALAAVQAVMAAYHRYYAESDPEFTQAVMRPLEAQRADTQNALTKLMEQRKILCGDEFTPATLERYYSSKLDELLKNESLLAAAQGNAEPQKVLLDTAPQPPVALSADEDLPGRLQRLVEAQKLVIKELRARVVQLQAIQEDEEHLKHELASLNSRFVELNDEYQLSNRAQFLSEGEPAMPVLAEKKQGHWSVIEPGGN